MKGNNRDVTPDSDGYGDYYDPDNVDDVDSDVTQDSVGSDCSYIYKHSQGLVDDK